MFKNILSLMDSLGGYKVILLFVAAAILAERLGEYAWEKWTLFAIAGAGLYFMGGARLFFPWRTTSQRAFSAGILVGTIVSTLIFLLSLKHR